MFCGARCLKLPRPRTLHLPDWHLIQPTGRFPACPSLPEIITPHTYCMWLTHVTNNQPHFTGSEISQAWRTCWIFSRILLFTVASSTSDQGGREDSLLLMLLLPQSPIINESNPNFCLSGREIEFRNGPATLNSTLLKRRREANGDRRKALMLKIGCHSCVAPGDNAKIMTNTGEDHCRAIRLQARADVRSYFGEAGRSQSV